tara:strand:+ start:1358 stop:1495 length:138 start_codon:yes stop_codon:yes gene_type:complete
MITRNPTWNFIIQNLREIHRTKKITKKVMKKIKELDQENEKSSND